MKKTSATGEFAVDNWKPVLGDLLIIAAVFAALGAFASMVPAHAKAIPGFVIVYDNGKQFEYHSVKGKQLTAYFTVDPLWRGNGVASFVYLQQENYDFFAVGFMKGWTPEAPHNPDPEWLSTPYYYVDRYLNGDYDFWLKEIAPMGITPHEYYVCGQTIMVAWIDGVPLQSESGYQSSYNFAAGCTESHDTRNTMNSYFFNMKAGPSLFVQYPFHDDINETDYPYVLTWVYPDTAWTATGGGIE